jgi:hypothetical protein
VVHGIPSGLIKAADPENSTSSGGSQLRQFRLLREQGVSSNGNANYDERMQQSFPLFVVPAIVLCFFYIAIF